MCRLASFKHYIRPSTRWVFLLICLELCGFLSQLGCNTDLAVQVNTLFRWVAIEQLKDINKLDFIWSSFLSSLIGICNTSAINCILATQQCFYKNKKIFKI